MTLNKGANFNKSMTPSRGATLNRSANLLAFRLLAWLLAPPRLLALCLALAATLSATGVAYATHLTRNMYRDLQQLEKDRDDLEHEYHRLLLEQGAWADYSRLNQLAAKELAMVAPDPGEMVVLDD
ncbi:MAG: cell division protein FtsL [Pseudomonadales bacterium]